MLIALLIFLPTLSYCQKKPGGITPGPTNPPPGPPIPSIDNKKIVNSIHYFNNSDFSYSYINADNNILLSRRELIRS